MSSLLYVGIDLHSTNSFISIINEWNNHKPIYDKCLPNDSERILEALSVYTSDIAGIVIESTYNWYWLNDALQAEGYQVHLANPTAMHPGQ